MDDLITETNHRSMHAWMQLCAALVLSEGANREEELYVSIY